METRPTPRRPAGHGQSSVTVSRVDGSSIDPQELRAVQRLHPPRRWTKKGPEPPARQTRSAAITRGGQKAASAQTSPGQPGSTDLPEEPLRVAQGPGS
eukprot:12609097-Alexandrium_andersonii.AAC.1